MPLARTDLNLAPARLLIDRHEAHDAPFDVEVDGLTLTILPGVFCPTFTKTSPFLARHVRVPEGASVLDVFSGSGYQGLLTARAGAASVVCVDQSVIATECATLNAARNGFNSVAKAMTGDVFGPVLGQRFDVVIANPPLLPGTPATSIEAAIFDPGLDHTVQFLGQVRDHLTRDGRAFLISTDAHRGMGLLDIESSAVPAGLAATAVAELALPYETYTVYELSPRGSR